jgi:3-oxoacyl-(acyl-carrier-protein) synthase
MRSALDHAGLAPDAVDYVNAHGTGTRANDPAEWRAIQHVFGERARALPVSASKSFLAHAQGAAGVLEMIATLVARERGVLPPTQRYTTARPHSPPDVVGQATARPARWRTALCTSSAFGGANCSVIVGDARDDAPVALRPIAIAGVATVDACARELDAIAPNVDPRGLDPATRALVAAAARALDDAGMRVHGEARARTGLVAGITTMSPSSDRALHDTIARHGLRGLSASLFARQVVNAPAGTCARLLGLRGAHAVVSAGAATGLLAIVYAAELLATRRDCDAIVAAGVDELGDGGTRDGASATVLATNGGVRVAGWSVAGPGRLDDAVARALAAAGLAAADRIVDDAEPASPAFASAQAVARAVALMRAEEARSVLVAQRGGRSADCALVLIEGG